MNPFSDELVQILRSGGVAVMPSDTIYGIVGSANIPETVSRIRDIKNRGSNEAFIVLCANMDQVAQFDIAKSALENAKKYWPGKVSIIMKPSKVHGEIQGNQDGIAFRIPDYSELQALLLKTGPLVAPSANPRGLEPARTIADAKAYFGDLVDFYADGGRREGNPSKLIKLHDDGSEEILRP